MDNFDIPGKLVLVPNLSRVENLIPDPLNMLICYRILGFIEYWELFRIICDLLCKLLTQCDIILNGEEVKSGARTSRCRTRNRPDHPNY